MAAHSTRKGKTWAKERLRDPNPSSPPSCRALALTPRRNSKLQELNSGLTLKSLFLKLVSSSQAAASWSTPPTLLCLLPSALALLLPDLPLWSPLLFWLQTSQLFLLLPARNSCFSKTQFYVFIFSSFADVADREHWVGQGVQHASLTHQTESWSPLPLELTPRSHHIITSLLWWKHSRSTLIAASKYIIQYY